MDFSFSMKVKLLIAVGVFSCMTLLMVQPIPQDLAYHDFADKRTIFNIANWADVVGNLAFIIVGFIGIIRVQKRKKTFLYPQEYLLWMVFFIGSFLVGFGSGYYHLAPTNQTLVWDRLPMTIAFMSLFSLMIMERIDAKAGFYLFPLFLLIGIGSVWYWDYSETLGQGDLRLYALVQFFPMIAIFFMLTQFPAQYTGSKYLAMTLVWYSAAKVLEHFDKEIFTLTTQLVSGHTLKHLAAAMAVGMLAQYVAKRQLCAQISKNTG